MPRNKRPSEEKGARVLQKRGGSGQNAIEIVNPELATAIADYRLANPETSFERIAIATGAARSTVQRYIERLEMRPTPEWLRAREVKQSELAGDYAKLAQASARAITDEKLEDASPRDLAVISGIATDKHLLLTGQPTAIFGVEDRRELHELLPALLAEVKRRGMDVPPALKDVTPKGKS